MSLLNAPCYISCVMELRRLERNKLTSQSMHARVHSLTIHEVREIDQILSSRSIVISQNLIVDEGQAEGVRTNHDYAEGMLAVWWFGDKCASTVH